MSRQLIKSLLSIYQNKSEFIQRSKTMLEFCSEYAVGEIQGTRIFFTVRDYNDIGMILEKRFGIDPKTRTDTWDGISRAEALKYGNNEKMSDLPVKVNRVCIKSLPGRTLYINKKKMELPDGANLDISLDNITVGQEHSSILLIENWMNFDHTHNTPILKMIDGNPLVLYRGDPQFSPKDSHRLMREVGLPVYAFVDYDPQGLLIAKSLPNFKDMIVPDVKSLKDMIKKAGNQDRFIDQKAANQKALLSLDHPTLESVWRILDHCSNALPQENLIELP